MDVVVLDEATWRARAEAHAARVDPYLRPHLARREARVKHPVHDFLFTYYSFRPAQLRRWHPGYGVALAGREATPYRELPAYDGDPVGVTESFLRQRADLVASIRELLVATQQRPAQFGCFGLHEWAMVYHLREDETRHHAHPLRLGTAGTDAVVDGHRITCSHFDAYRFFTPDARPLNTLRPGPDDRPEFEQPGCLHAGMDLYKHASRLAPLVGSDLVADAFELAWEARNLDMRGAPYDVRDLGFEPIRIETPEGRQEYAAQQRALAESAAPLRRRLVDATGRLLEAAGAPTAPAGLR